MGQPESPSDRKLLDALPVPAMLLDPESHIVEAANAAFTQQLAAEGISPQSLTGLRTEMCDEILDTSVLDILDRLSSPSPLTIRCLPLWKMGETAHVEMDVIASPVGETDARLLIVFLESSSSTRSQIQSRQLNRMEILGILTAGIAHDINNQLSATMNIASLLESELKESGDERRAEALEILGDSSREAANLAHRLLRFAGRGVPRIESIVIKNLIEKTVLLLRHDLPPAETLQLDMGEDSGTLRGDAILLEQLLATVLLSGRHANSLRIRAGEVKGSLPAALQDRDRNTGGYVEISVRADSGFSGESPAMDAARQIAEEHGGAIITTTDNGDTHHRVLLPRDTGDVGPEQDEEQVETPAKDDVPGGATVLLVDDEKMVLDVGQAMIQRLGHRSLGANGGKEALKLLHDHEEIDLVILDLQMKEMDGITTLEHIRKIRPELKVILSSGYSDPTTDWDRRDLTVQGSLEKPYSLGKLRNILESALA